MVRHILPLLLLVLIAASPPKRNAEEHKQDAYQNLSGAAQLRAGLATNKPIEPAVYKPPCAEPEDHDQCDLEAQWKAAEAGGRAAQAARDAIYWTKWQTILSGLGIGGLLVSLWLTREATKAATRSSKDSEAALAAAQKSATAAVDQVAVARTASERQLRAYVGVDSITIRPADDNHFAAQITFKNYGQTPAYNCVVFTAAAVDKWPSIDPSESGIKPSAQTRHVTLHPTAEMLGFAACDASGQMEAIDQSDAAVYVFGRIDYKDVQGVQRTSNFAYRGTGGVFFRTLELHLCLGGNTAT